MDDDFLQGEISSLTDMQEISMSLVTIFSGLLSILGSSAIIYRVLKGSGRTPKSYDRIMLGLSICDILTSITYAVTPLLLPQATSQRVWARGSETSCLFLGFLTQLSLTAVTYNCLLSFYYLATIKFSMTASDFASNLEPYFHILTVFFFLFTATGGVVFDIFAELELGQGCWVSLCGHHEARLHIDVCSHKIGVRLLSTPKVAKHEATAQEITLLGYGEAFLCLSLLLVCQSTIFGFTVTSKRH